MFRRTAFLTAVTAAIALCDGVSAAAPEDKEANIERARAALIARLKAAEQSGIILSRPEEGDAEAIQAAPAAHPTEPATSAIVSKSGARAHPSQNRDDCITDAMFAATRDALGADPIASIDLLRRLAQEPHQKDQSEVLNQLALAYLSVGFADEAVAILRQSATPGARNKMLQLIAAAGGTADLDIADADLPMHCGALITLAAFAASGDRAAPAEFGQDEIGALTALPRPLAMAIAARAASRLMDLRDIAHAEQVLELMTGFAVDSDGAHLSLLYGKLAALKAATTNPADLVARAFPEELEKASLLVEHPEFIDAVDAAAAQSALALLADLGAPEAIKQSKLAGRQPPATAALALATAYARAGAYAESATIAEGHPNDKAFEPVRAAIALAANSDAAATNLGRSARAAAWRSGDWTAAQEYLAAAFMIDPSVLSAGKLAIAAALGGQGAPPPAAAAVLRADRKGAALLSWFSPPPQRRTIASVRAYAQTIATEAATMREMAHHE